jgi:imidazolonepropionase
VSSLIAEHLTDVRRRLTAAAQRGRPADIPPALIAVSKTFPADDVRAAAAAGQQHFGENRVQEGLDKIAATADLDLTWHLIGHLQTNKARKAAAAFAWIHSVDSLELLRKLDAGAADAGTQPNILLQVDLAQEATKFGVPPEALRPLIDAALGCTHVRLRGLMIIPPAVDDPDDARPWFVRLRTLRDELVAQGVPSDALAHLSMGMSHDFEVAIEEGATWVRVGSAIFGQRPPLTDSSGAGLQPRQLRPVSLLIEHLDQLYTVAGPGPRAGVRQGDIAPIADGAIAAQDGLIVAAGTTAEVRAQVQVHADTVVVDGRGKSLVPGFVDAHTHVVFAGDRRDELRMRLSGATYAEIAAAGGGILSTVRATRAASEQALIDATAPRLAAMLRAGTTTAESKSGYGLDLDTEMRMLRVSRALEAVQPVELVHTFMGAHEVPPDYRGRQTDYVRLVIDEMIPAAAGLAEWCDVFCDRGFFTPEESVEILEAGLRVGLKPRIHADELAASGGSQVAGRVGARSADHLVHVPPDGVAAMAGAGVVATLLPCAAFYLKLGQYAPARAMIAAGVPVALATDVNPGGGFSPSMPFAMTLACFGMGLTFEEALVAATINGAASLDRQNRVGSLEVGKQCDAVLIDGPAVNLLRINAAPIVAVYKKGIRC